MSTRPRTKVLFTMSSKKRGSVSSRRERPSLDSVSSTNSLTSSDSSWGLHPSIQKELLRDIELRGGLGRVNLKALLDDKSDLYGLPNTNLRRQVRNKVDRWKKKSSTEFESIKQALRHTSSSLDSNQLPAANFPQQHNQHDHSIPLVVDAKVKSPPLISRELTRTSNPFPSLSLYLKKSTSSRAMPATMNNIKIHRKYPKTILSLQCPSKCFCVSHLSFPYFLHRFNHC